MNVTLISMAYPHPRAGFWPGIERQVGDLAASLREAGARVSVVTSFRNGGEPQEDHRGVTIHRVIDAAHARGRAGYLFCRHVRSFGRNALGLTDVIRRSDVIQSFVPLPRHPALERPDLSLFAFFAHRDRPARWREYLHMPIQFRMEREFYQRVQAVIVASTESKRVLMAEYGVSEARIEVVPLGVGQSFLRSADDAVTERGAGSGEPARILYVGPLIRRKGLHTLLEALAIVRDAGVSFQMVLAGSGPEQGPLAERCAAMGLADRVRFPGFVAEADLPRLYRDADLFVFPSLKEGFGLVLAEAMATGLPIVASSVPPIPEVVGDAGLLFRAEDPADLAATLIRALGDRDLLRLLGERGRRRARERYDWRRIADRTLEVFRRPRAA